MILVICEKPSQAQGYASVLGANERKGGFFIGNGYIVAYCFGHLLELASPDAYGEQYSKWRYADLPIVPKEWKHVPIKDKATQLKVLTDLMNRADVEAIAAACDGQSVVITGVERQRKTVAPPKLYNLTMLQRDANRLLGYTAQQTLEYIQSLSLYQASEPLPSHHKPSSGGTT